jgi:hypothetical protein
MVEKTNNETLKKQDLELIIEVNKKAIEIESEVVEQNEEIISSLSEIQSKQEEQTIKINKLVDQAEITSRDIFRMQVLFVTGLISIIVQIISIFFKK